MLASKNLSNAINMSLLIKEETIKNKKCWRHDKKSMLDPIPDFSMKS